jgi:hypothetical protein
MHTYGNADECIQMHDNAAEDGNASYYRCIKMHLNAPDTEYIVMQQM